MRPCDEDHLTGLIIQATPFMSLPSIDDIDQNRTIWGMLSRYLKHSTPELAEDIAEHLKELLVNHFQGQIQQLMDDAHSESPEAERERSEARIELNRDIYCFDKQRI